MARITEKSEVKRLLKIYEGLTPKRYALAQGMIVQAARIRVRLNELSAFLDEHGMTEMFQQSEKVDPYSKTRPEADLFVKLDKNYQAIMRQLDAMIPAEEDKNETFDVD